MAIPDYQSLMYPVLEAHLSKDELYIQDLLKLMSELYKLTDDEKKELLPSGLDKVMDNRVGWARTYLKKAGLLEYSRRGHTRLTAEGKNIFDSEVTEINNKFLRNYESFREFTRPKPKASNNKNVVTHENIDDSSSPEENLENIYLDLKSTIVSDLKDQLSTCNPTYFEQIVVDVIVAMGYGGSKSDAGRAIGRSSDEGIDGVIKEDKLGLDLIYLQAKRWAANVGRPEIQKFSGALQGKRAKKGIFLTTSTFSSEAREFVKNIDAKIILIDGDHLCELMWEYNVGVEKDKVFELKKLNIDYFEAA